jgi:hypothetical protein
LELVKKRPALLFYERSLQGFSSAYIPFSQTVHARSSYKPDEIVWNARFEDIFNYAPGQGSVSIDVRRNDIIKRLEPESESVTP